MFKIEFYEKSDGTSDVWDFLETLRLKSFTNKDIRIQYNQLSMYIIMPKGRTITEMLSGFKNGILNDIAKENPGVDDSQTKTSFFGYGDFSLTIRYIYYIDKVKGGYYRTQTEVNMAILERFNASGLEFAFPTQSLYVENMKGSVGIKKEN